MLQFLLPLQALLGPGGGMVDTPDLKSCDFRVVRVQVPPGVHLKHVKRLIINSNRAFSFLNAGVFGALFYIECFQNEINRKKSQEL